MVVVCTFFSLAYAVGHGANELVHVQSDMVTHADLNQSAWT